MSSQSMPHRAPWFRIEAASLTGSSGSTTRRVTGPRRSIEAAPLAGSPASTSHSGLRSRRHRCALGQEPGLGTARWVRSLCWTKGHNPRAHAGWWAAAEGAKLRGSGSLGPLSGVKPRFGFPYSVNSGVLTLCAASIPGTRLKAQRQLWGFDSLCSVHFKDSAHGTASFLRVLTH